jgi:hypothetical protein
MPESTPMSFDEPMPNLAKAIRNLELAPLQTPLEQMCYIAGFEAGRKRAGAWRRIAAIIALAAGVTIAWEHRSAEPSRTRDYVKLSNETNREGPSSAERSFSPATTSANLRLRQAMLSAGWDALPQSAGDQTAPPRPLESLSSDGHLLRHL